MNKVAINIDPELMGGTPVFAGTRVPVESLFDWLETETLDEFIENFPSVEKKHALEVLHIAQQLVTSVNVSHENLA
jgi:uncharacterized protein (DUF433 family)